MRPIDQSKIAKKYRGKWIALKADRKTVVASGTSVKKVLIAAKKKGYEQPIVTRMPKSPSHFIGPSTKVHVSKEGG